MRKLSMCGTSPVQVPYFLDRRTMQPAFISIRVPIHHGASGLSGAGQHA